MNQFSAQTDGSAFWMNNHSVDYAELFVHFLDCHSWEHLSSSVAGGWRVAVHDYAAERLVSYQAEDFSGNCNIMPSVMETAKLVPIRIEPP